MMLAAGPENMVSTGVWSDTQGQSPAVCLEDIDRSGDLPLHQGLDMAAANFP